MSDQSFPDDLPVAHAMHNQPKVPAGEIYDLIKEHRGNKGAVARELGWTRTRLEQRINRSPDLQELISDMREGVVDQAEGNMFKRVESGADPAAEKFILSTIGRGRGYSTSVAGAGPNGDIVVTIKRFGEGEEE